jgi:hypothetical protein
VLDGFTITDGYADGSGLQNLGGGLFNSGGRATVRNCRFIGNVASISGGAVFNISGGDATFINCIFVDNMASVFGGAIHNDQQSSPAFINCSLSGNVSTFPLVVGGGGGMYNSLNSSPTVVNSVAWGNISDGVSSDVTAQIASDGSGSMNVTYSCIQDADPSDGSIPFGGAANSNIDDDPLFADADLRLTAPGSPCIGRGDNTSIPAGVTTDLDGNPRRWGGTVDLGAYETQ